MVACDGVQKVIKKMCVGGGCDGGLTIVWRALPTNGMLSSLLIGGMNERKGILSFDFLLCRCF